MFRSWFVYENNAKIKKKLYLLFLIRKVDRKNHNILVKLLQGKSNIHIYIFFTLKFKQYGFIFTHLQLAKHKKFEHFLFLFITFLLLTHFQLAQFWLILVYFMFESLYICTNIFYMVTKINCETYTWIVNTMIEFLPLNFPPKLKTIVYICLNVLIDDMSWKIRCNSFSPPASAIILIIYGISSRYTDNLMLTENISFWKKPNL